MPSKLKFALFATINGQLSYDITQDDIIYYDVTQGFKIEIDKTIYHVIKLQDVVVVL